MSVTVVQIIAACEDIHVARQLAMVWGVFPIVVGHHDKPFSVTNEIDKACQVYSISITDEALW